MCHCLHRLWCVFLPLSPLLVVVILPPCPFVGGGGAGSFPCLLPLPPVMVVVVLAPLVVAVCKLSQVSQTVPADTRKVVWRDGAHFTSPKKKNGTRAPWAVF